MSELKVPWQAVVYGGQPRANLERYSKREPIACYRCGEPVLKLTGSFVNVSEKCTQSRLEEKKEPSKDLDCPSSLDERCNGLSVGKQGGGDVTVFYCVHCEQPFSRRQQPKQKYCSKKCGLAHRVARSRKRKKQLELN